MGEPRPINAILNWKLKLPKKIGKNGG